MISDRIKLFSSENNQILTISKRKINESEKQSIELFNNGKNPDEIANIHDPKLRVGTIWEHIAKGVSLKLIDASSYLSDDCYMEIESFIKRYIKKNHIIERLKPIYESLESEYHYEQIKYVISLVSKEKLFSSL